MPKVRKQKRAKKYRFGVNRKRMNKKMTKLPRIQCDQIRSSYENNKTMIQNITEMGLSYNPNKSIKLPNTKEIKSNSTVEPVDKSNVVEEIETDVKHPREKMFRLPKTMVQWLCKLIDAYGDDYKKMSADEKLNPMQDTWKQIRAKIKQFQKIPQQWEPYVKSKMEVSAST